MDVIYPRDWDDVGATPQIIIYEPKQDREIDLKIIEIDGVNANPKEQSAHVEARSRSGRVRVLTLINVKKKTSYAVQIFSKETCRVVRTIAINVAENIHNIDLSDASDSIENVYHVIKNVRFVSNGIGKSGTSWLYYLLGSLPGANLIDMPGFGFSGARPEELAKVPLQNVYHGHLGCSLEVIEALDALDFMHVFIYRDLRDMIVSEYYHKFHFQKTEFIQELLDIGDNLLDFDMIHKWSTSIYAVSAVLDWRRSGKCVMVSYEDLSASPEETFSRALSGLGLNCHHSLVAYIIRRCDFTRFSGGRARGEADASSFFRCGVVGGWRDHLSLETAQQIVEYYADYYELLGYRGDSREYFSFNHERVLCGNRPELSPQGWGEGQGMKKAAGVAVNTFSGTLDGVTQERDHLRRVLSGAWLRHRPPESLGACALGVSEVPGEVDDAALIERIRKAFRRADATPVGDGASMWLTAIADIRKAENQIMRNGDLTEITGMLRDPGATNLCYGFEFDDIHTIHTHLPPWNEWVYDCLLRLAEAVGTIRLEYPEAPPHKQKVHDVEELLSGLDRVFGFRVEFKNICPRQVGLVTSRGVATFRAVQALYHAWRTFEYVGHNPAARILEIGSGFGWAAYFARQFGLAQYTIVDLPLTSVAQAYFLGRTLGPEALSLFGETEGGSLSIIPPSAFFESDDRYDLVLNADSLTEMAPSTANEYWRAIVARASIFLSINHEYNSFSVRDIVVGTPGIDIVRAPYWLRRGYVEEVMRGAAP